MNKTLYEWNGEPCIVRFIYVEIYKCESNPLHWQNAFIGQTRQAIQVKSGNSIFIIDNNDGAGFMKVTNGGGMDYGHKAFDQIAIKGLIADVEVKRAFNFDLYKIEKMLIDAEAEKADPDGFKKLKALEALIKNKNYQ